MAGRWKAVIIATIALTACSGSDAAVQVTAATTTPAPLPESPSGSQSGSSQPSDPAFEASVRAYFDALATHEPGAMRAMIDAAEPGSPAHTYAVVQSTGAAGKRDAGIEVEAETATYTPNAVRLCTPSDGDCLEFTNLHAGSGGRLQTFRVGGSDLAVRTATGDGTAVRVGDASFQFLAAYESVQYGGLLVVLQSTAGHDSLAIDTDTTSYVEQNGTVAPLGGALGAASVGARTSAVSLLGFQGVGIGGVATLGLRQGDSPATVRLSITG